MIRISIVDRTAESRSELLTRFSTYVELRSDHVEFIPRIDLKPITPEELKFHTAPDLCIIGSELISSELTEIAKIRKILPETPLLVCINEELQSLSTVEQMARLGADDTLTVDSLPQEFLRKVVLLARRTRPKSTAKLVVIESGKGGVGVTSIAATLAEACAKNERKTLLIDLDCETQDLSRFLQVRPFVNENLQLLLEGSRPVTQEYVEQCVSPVWEDEPHLFCMPPIIEHDQLYTLGGNYARNLLSVFEYLDELFDCIVIDSGSIRGALQQSIYHAADYVLFLLNNDPATLYGSVDKIKRLTATLSVNSSLLVAENGSHPHGLARRLVLEEFSRAAELQDDQWFSQSIPFTRTASRWPGSGETLASSKASRLYTTFQRLGNDLTLFPPERSGFERVFRSSFPLFKHLFRKFETTSPHPERVVLPSDLESRPDTLPLASKHQLPAPPSSPLISSPIVTKEAI